MGQAKLFLGGKVLRGSVDNQNELIGQLKGFQLGVISHDAPRRSGNIPGRVARVLASVWYNPVL
jgi:hypothetical protein